MRKLATIATVETVHPIPNSDNLDVITLKNRFWRLVVGRDNVKPGDCGVYFEIDSVLPEEPQFEFLRARCYVENALNKGFLIRTMTLRKQISQGLFIPLADFSRNDYSELVDLAQTAEEGTDVTELLNIKLYERPNDGCLDEDALGNFPSFIQKTDQERIQNLPELFDLYKNEEFEITTKLDGSSQTVAWFNGEPILCSRNLQKKYDPENPQGDFSQLIHKLELFDKLKNYGKNLAFQGEFVGPGIQSNRAKFAEKSFFIFDIWDIDRQIYLDPLQRTTALNDIFGNTNLMVPLVRTAKILLEFPTFDSLMGFADTVTINGRPAEGIVCKMISNPMISFKVISNKYLMKEK